MSRDDPITRIEATRVEMTRVVERALDDGDLAAAHDAVADLSVELLVDVLERLDPTDRAVLYRLLPKDQAMEVFEQLDPSLQSASSGVCRTITSHRFSPISSPTIESSCSTSCRPPLPRSSCADFRTTSVS